MVDAKVQKQEAETAFLAGRVFKLILKFWTNIRQTADHDAPTACVAHG